MPCHHLAVCQLVSSHPFSFQLLLTFATVADVAAVANFDIVAVGIVAVGTFAVDDVTSFESVHSCCC